MKLKYGYILATSLLLLSCTGYVNTGSPSRTSGADYNDESFFGGPSAKYLGDSVYMITVSGGIGMTKQGAYTVFHDYARKIVQDNGYAGYTLLDYDSFVNSINSWDAQGRIKCYK